MLFRSLAVRVQCERTEDEMVRPVPPCFLHGEPAFCLLVGANPGLSSGATGLVRSTSAGRERSRGAVSCGGPTSTPFACRQRRARECTRPVRRGVGDVRHRLALRSRGESGASWSLVERKGQFHQLPQLPARTRCSRSLWRSFGQAGAGSAARVTAARTTGSGPKVEETYYEIQK